MTYNLTPGGNATGLLQLIQIVNDELMFGYLGVLWLIVIIGIAFMAFLASTDNAGKSIIVSGFIGVIAAVFLKALGLIPDLALYILIILTAASLAFKSN